MESDSSEVEYDYQNRDEDVQKAWDYLDSISDKEIVELVEYAKGHLRQDRIKEIILPVLRAFAKSNGARMCVRSCGSALHVEITLDNCLVVDSDDTVVRTVLMMAKGICVELQKGTPGKLHMELDYE